MKRFAPIIAICIVLLAWPVQAQEGPILSDLEIALWPEYDRPEVLVIYKGMFAPETPLPVPVEIRIPASVGQPTAVAYVGEGGQLLNQPNTVRVEDDWLVVSFELPTQGFQLEYYDTLPVSSTGLREYTYTYVADYPVSDLSVEFQVPPTAEAATLEPPSDSVAPDSDGLLYHRSNLGSVTQGEEQTWTFAYQKDDSDLTVSAFVQPETAATAPVPSAATGSDDSSTVLIFLVAFVTLVAVGGAAFWLGSRTQSMAPESPPPSKRYKRRGSGRGDRPQGQEFPPSRVRGVFFCHQCGAEQRPDAQFCHECGTAVRGE
jgi:hypothetical protein